MTITTRELREYIQVKRATIAGALNQMLEEGRLVRLRKANRRCCGALLPGRGKRK